jgi:hypothetical protein
LYRYIETLLIHFRAKSAVKGLFWNAKQKKPFKLYAFAPDLVHYVAHGLEFMATSGLYGILLALLRCNKVDVYGFQVSTAHGTLYHYYDVRRHNYSHMSMYWNLLFLFFFIPVKPLKPVSTYAPATRCATCRRTWSATTPSGWWCASWPRRGLYKLNAVDP